MPKAATGAIAAALHLLLYLGPPKSRLGYDDVVVLNFGLHYWTDLSEQMRELLSWWTAERAARRAPRLLWRETSPQHFQGYGGLYSGDQAKWTSARHAKAFADSDGESEATTYQCRALTTSEALATYRADRGNNAVWPLALPHSGNSSWVGVLPVFWPTVPLQTEHPLIYWYDPESRKPGHGAVLRSNPGGEHVVYLPDCTHYCNPGSSLRLWTQMLVSHMRHWKHDHEHHVSSSGQRRSHFPA
uniref:Uncharacterized protein n=1 Tax=Calcidiscus leptoporus TaxID=127549 RepID=A0A7S0IKD2_9EUKA